MKKRRFSIMAIHIHGKDELAVQFCQAALKRVYPLRLIYRKVFLKGRVYIMTLPFLRIGRNRKEEMNVSVYDGKIGYLAPWLSHDLNQWMKSHPDVTFSDIAKKCGMARQPFKSNFTTGKSATVTFLAKYALATGRDIPSFFADVGSIVNLQVKGIQPYGEEPEPLIYQDMQVSKKKQKTKPKKKKSVKRTKKVLKAEPIVEWWQRRNLGGKQSECVKETGLSRSAVARNWNKDLAKKKE